MSSASKIDVDIPQFHWKEVQFFDSLNVEDVFPDHMKHVVLTHQRRKGPSRQYSLKFQMSLNHYRFEGWFIDI